jgi:hypothetical protein
VIDMLRNHRWVPGAFAAIALLAALPVASSARTLGVEVWTDRGDDAVYQAGDAMQVKVRASDDAYLLVYEIDSEGGITVLYPWRRSSNLVEGHRTYRFPPEGSNYELAVEKATGQGYIVAIASRQPFRDLPWYLRPYDPQGEGAGYEDRHDDEDGFDENGHVVGDPMVAMERVRRRVLGRPGDTEDFATSYASYYVGHEVRYPRYLCNDCHRPSRWAWWDGFDPYYSRCSVFDFRVNWNWCWGPCAWSGNVPYFYYVVRSDCPPRWHDWYDNHTRWSSWDGYQQRNKLWGGDMNRRKSPPPPGYTPPAPAGKPAWNPGVQPPGYLPVAGGGVLKRGGFREPLPIGRNRQAIPDESPRQGGTWRPPGVSERPRDEGQRQPVVRPIEPPRPAYRPPANEGGAPPQARTPERRPETPAPAYQPPRQESPRQEQPREEPRRQPARQDPPHQDKPREPEHRDPPKRER